MGDVIRKVKVCVRRNGRLARCATVPALVDSGSTKTVIGRQLADALGVKVERQAVTLETSGRRLKHFDAAALELLLGVKGCPPVRTNVVVDDGLAAKAGPRAEMILGTDYMQQGRIAILFGPREKDHVVACVRRGRNGRRSR